jgi:hypothetical protein
MTQWSPTLRLVRVGHCEAPPTPPGRNTMRTSAPQDTGTAVKMFNFHRTPRGAGGGDRGGRYFKIYSKFFLGSGLPGDRTMQTVRRIFSSFFKKQKLEVFFQQNA